MSVKILHAADFHMDSPFDALPDEKAAQRRREQRDLLRRMADICEKEKVQIALFPGDLLDSAASYYETHEALCSAFSKISCEIFIAPGNHDYYCPQSPYASLDFPENVHIFRSASIKSIEIKELGCRVWGAGFNSEQCPSLLHGFSVPETDEYINIMLLHGDLKSRQYNYIDTEDIAGSGLDYLALGHVHSYSGILKAGKTTYAYPGCPEGRGFDETGEKGIIVGSVGADGCDLRFVPMGGREYHRLEVSVSGAEDIEKAVEDALPENTERDIYRVILRGETDLDINLEKLQEAFADRFYQVEFRNDTKPEKNAAREPSEETLGGMFIKKLTDAMDSGDPDEMRKAALAVIFGYAALDDREEPQR